MKYKLKNEKKEMALIGYYIGSDFAKLRGHSRQFFSFVKDKMNTIERYGRTWYKYDNGDLGKQTHGELGENLNQFIQYGFTKKTKVFMQNTCYVEIKEINPKQISVRFHANNGSMASLVCDYDNIEHFND